MVKHALGLFFATFVAVGCASNRPPPSNSASPVAPDHGGSGTDGKSWADAQRETFMSGCAAKVNAPDYCACGFDQFRVVFKDGPPPEGQSPQPQYKLLAERTQSECASKLPEDVMKGSFVAACTGDDKRKAAYCECAWPALRKNLALSDFATDFEGPRFDAAKKSMAQTCKGKYPTEVAKAEFVKGCSKDDTAKARACDCIWKKLRAKYGTEEILTGTVDVDSVGVSDCKG